MCVCIYIYIYMYMYVCTCMPYTSAALVCVCVFFCSDARIGVIRVRARRPTYPTVTTVCNVHRGLRSARCRAPYTNAEPATGHNAATRHLWNGCMASCAACSSPASSMRGDACTSPWTACTGLASSTQRLPPMATETLSTCGIRCAGSRCLANWISAQPLLSSVLFFWHWVR